MYLIYALPIVQIYWTIIGQLIINKISMSNSTIWRECGCWCLFSLSSILILLLVTLILNDMSLVSQHEALLDQMINTPIARLNCDQICQSWYAVENKQQCCDRLNINLCVPKEQCKNQYQKKTDETVRQIQAGKLYKIIMVLVCIAMLLITLCRKKRATKVQESKQEIQARMQKMLANLIQKLQLQNVIDRNSPYFQQEQQIIKKKFKELYQKYKNKQVTVSHNNQDESIEMDQSMDYIAQNKSYLPMIIKTKKFCPNLIKQIKEHQCQKCIFKKINQLL